MTPKPKNAKRKSGKKGVIERLFASVEDDLFLLAEGEPRPESHWNRPRKQRISLRVDREVLAWFKSNGPGYQTRINRILRRVMQEGKNRARG